MALYLTSSEARQLLTMDQCIQVLEELFRQEAAGLTDNLPRQGLRLPRGFHRVMAGAVYSLNTFGVKSYAAVGGPTHYLLLLYGLDSGALEAIVDARDLSQVRTGALSGLATKYMAREEAGSVSIIGTGWQASAQLEAVCAVRPITHIKAYSRTSEKREAFAQEMTEKLRVPVVAVASAAECVRDTDVVITITSAWDPVMDGSWLKPGAHVNAAGATAVTRREVDEETVKRADVVVVESLQQALIEGGELIWPADRGTFRWSQAVELRDVVTGLAGRRSRPDSITLFNSLGIAIEDIAVGAHVVKLARERGLGQELPL